mgnify:CR=1 FL=1
MAFFITKIMRFINKDIDQYSSKLTTLESKILEDLNRETWLKMMNPRMLSGHIQGRFLSMISKMLSPNNILEIGTYTGYSALCLAEGLNKGGKIHTIDINEESVSIAKKYFKRSIYKDNIIQHIGNAIDIIPRINNNIELAFIDADKENYSTYYNLIFKKLKVGGYIIADNVLWSGKVLNKEQDKETKALSEYNNLIHNDERVENILLPIRDGLMICKKISD